MCAAYECILTNIDTAKLAATVGSTSAGLVHSAGSKVNSLEMNLNQQPAPQGLVGVPFDGELASLQLIVISNEGKL